MRWLKKGRLSLKKAHLEELRGDYVSPGRGWYHIYTFQPDRQDEEQLKWLPLEEKETLVLLRLDIGAFRNREIDEQTLLFMERIFARFAEADKDIILRVVYDVEGKGMVREPSGFSLVCSHMRSIGALVAKHKEKILLAQGVFIGSWGEMHDSKFLHPEQLRSLWRVWNEATAGTVSLAVRRPVYARMILGKKASEDNLGLYDDALLADETHMGTFGNKRRVDSGWEEGWLAKDELVYMKQSMNHVPAGGEALMGHKKLSREDTLGELKEMRITYLNRIYQPERIADWEKQKLEDGQNLLEYIGNHMGYRLVVRDVSLSGTRLAITIENNGFAPIYETAQICAVSVDLEQGERDYVLPIDLRELQPGNKQTYRVDNPLPSDVHCGFELYLKATRLRDRKAICFANEGAEDKLLIGRME